MAAIEINIYCKCGRILDSVEVDQYADIMVEPCESCMEKEYKDGHKTGRDEGYEAGFEDGYNEGLDEGRRTA